MRQRSQKFDSRQNMTRSNYEVFHYNEPPKNDVEVHSHDFYEIFFLINGNISYWMEGEVYNPAPGDILLIDPMTLHRPIISKDNKTYERIVIWINKSYLDNFKENELDLSFCFQKSIESQKKLLHPSSMQKSKLTEKLSSLINEYYSDSYGSSLYSDSLLLQVMIELNRLVSNNAQKPIRQHGTSTLVSQILDYIGKNYREEISLDSLAEHFFVSKYHLSHEFSKETGTSLYRYIMLKRLIEAKQLLQQNITAGEAAIKCGFNDYSSFFRAYKSEYGISPREYFEST